ncbi:MAG: Ribosomal RNA small subunit methyltransferase H [Pelotomaculum sp. PtaU1.Bin065]|nr:MAG: Ribosomal RNA small subunit methyltransferase H [Pelotomaculum sp. PtaU1.Bin065]
MNFAHVPVMLVEAVTGLSIKQNGIYVDCTLGGAGHSESILEQNGPRGRLIAFDQDPEAIAYARVKLAPYHGRVEFVQANFKELAVKLNQLNIDCVDGVLFDLGASSHQFDDPARGFSYLNNAPLDMRMNPEQEITARTLVNELSVKELAWLIKEYGEERWASRIAEFIQVERSRRPLETTGQLVEVIKKAIPARARRSGPHPAKRTFQALRIAVNNELEVLTEAVCSAIHVLGNEGRICVISFHSLEDRIIKDLFREHASPCSCPKELPVCVCGKKKVLNIITAKPLVPGPAELEFNPRSRSARLRIAEKVLN